MTLSLTVQILLVMTHCNGYAHPKPDNMTDAEHVEFHHARQEVITKEVLKTTEEAIKTTEEAIKNTEEVLKTTKEAIKTTKEAIKTTEEAIKLLEELTDTVRTLEREALSCYDLIAFLVVIGGIIFIALIIKRGLKPRRQIKPRHIK